MAQRKSEAEWTPEAIQRFWNWHGACQPSQAVYFTAMVGRGVVRFLDFTGRLRGTVLDYGCGPGHLIAQLVRRPVECYAADVSEDSVTAVASRFEGHRNFRRAAVADGTAIPFPDGFFDLVLCVETLEHLPSAVVPALLGEMKRVLRPGGTALLTTPFAEDLEQNLTYCPFCNSEFHRWQHVRSYDAEGLSTLLSAAGFQVIFCRNMDFFAFQDHDGFPPLAELNWRGLKYSVASRMRKILDRLFPAPFPQGRELSHRLRTGSGRHLCALATAPREKGQERAPCAG